MSPGRCGAQRCTAALPFGDVGLRPSAVRMSRIASRMRCCSRGGQRLEHLDDVGSRARVERSEGALARGREAENVSDVGRRGRDFVCNQAALLECAKRATEIAAIETERLGDLARRRAFAMRELVEHAHLRERECRCPRCPRRVRRCGGCRSG